MKKFLLVSLTVLALLAVVAIGCTTTTTGGTTTTTTGGATTTTTGGTTTTTPGGTTTTTTGGATTTTTLMIAPSMIIDGTKDANWDSNPTVIIECTNDSTSTAGSDKITFNETGKAYVCNDANKIYFGVDLSHDAGSSQLVEVLIYKTASLDNDSPEQNKVGGATLYNFAGGDPEYVCSYKFTDGDTVDGWYAKQWDGSSWNVIVAWQDASMDAAVSSANKWFEGSINLADIGVSDISSLKFAFLASAGYPELDGPVWDIIPAGDTVNGDIWHKSSDLTIGTNGGYFSK